MNRRQVMAGALLVLLPLASAAPSPPAGDFSGCVAQLRRELPQYPQVRAASFDELTRRVTDLRPVIEAATRNQPEFTLPVWDYVARLADAEREADGREVLRRERSALAAIEARHGVDAATVVAVFGVETDFGRVAGRHAVVDATLSRACLNPASRERKAHFFAALWLLQEGLVQPESFRGSWAGAFGLTQFMPGTFVRYLDDGDGDGRPDIVSSVPDALATTARYLAALGWSPGLPWGWEVRVPADLATARNALQSEHACATAPAPQGRCLTLAAWAVGGAVRLDGGTLEGDTPAALLMPAGVDGPAWLVTRNFHALWQYNRADAYALAISLLASGLRGEPAMRGAWPTDDPGLSRSEMRELQALLIARGHADLRVDGADGPRTQAAVRAEQEALALPATGRPGQVLLQRLRALGTPADGAPPAPPTTPGPAASVPQCSDAAASSAGSSCSALDAAGTR